MSKSITNISKTTKHKREHFFLLSIITIFIAPIILVILYDKLAGGILNGLAGSWSRATINPDVFLLFINPITFIILYLLLFLDLRIYLKKSDSKKELATVVFLIATIVTAIGIFWKALTT